MYQTLFDRTSSVSQYEIQTFNNRLKTTLTLDMSRNGHMHVRLAVNRLAALKRFNQTTFVALTKFAATQILSQYMTSDHLTSCEQIFYFFIGLHLSTNTKAPRDTSQSHLIWMAGRNCLLQTAKGMSQLLSWGCHPTIPAVRLQFYTVYCMKSTR